MRVQLPFAAALRGRSDVPCNEPTCNPPGFVALPRADRRPDDAAQSQRMFLSLFPRLLCVLHHLPHH